MAGGGRRRVHLHKLITFIREHRTKRTAMLIETAGRRTQYDGVGETLCTELIGRVISIEMFIYSWVRDWVAL